MLVLCVSEEDLAFLSFSLTNNFYACVVELVVASVVFLHERLVPLLAPAKSLIMTLGIHFLNFLENIMTTIMLRSSRCTICMWRSYAGDSITRS